MKTTWNNSQLTTIAIILQLGCDKFDKFSNVCNFKCNVVNCLAFAQVAVRSFYLGCQPRNFSSDVTCFNTLRGKKGLLSWS